MPFITFFLATAACAAGCRDNPAAAMPLTESGSRFAGTVVCAVDVKAARTRCEVMRNRPTGNEAARFVIVPNAQMMVQTGADAYTPADSTYRLNLRLVNTSGTVLGTRDGTTVSGIKAFIPVNVMGYAGRPPGDTTKPYGVLIPPISNINQLVKARNPDGRLSFTGPDQPYWNYAETLDPGQTSQWRQWSFTLDPRVSYFYFAVSIFAGAPGEQAVPVVIPESWSEPARYSDPTYDVTCRPVGWPRCVYDVVDVTFRPGASQEERQAAVELVGALEGGSRMNGIYFVRITNADTTFAAMKEAIRTLEALPQVEWVRPHDRTRAASHYLKPIDGPQWTDWQVRDSAADGENWSHEAVSLPLAWGCETGSDSSNLVAVVDHDFHAVQELLNTYDASTSIGVGQFTSANDAEDHGTMVASIIASRGNDATGITGVMWRPRIRLLDAAEFDAAGKPKRTAIGDAIVTLDDILGRIRQAGRGGAAVVNVSMSTDWNVVGAALGWTAPGGTYNPALETSAGRKDTIEMVLRGWYRDYKQVMDTLAGQGYRPLVVMSAGNEGRDARYDPRRVAGDSLANTLVVGAVRDAGAGVLAPMHAVVGGQTEDTNTGTPVRIAAPGQGIALYTSRGLGSGAGTSFAAPIVSGVAGLLVAFDPRLAGKPDSLRDLLLQGALRGRRTVMLGGRSVPVLHAYEALKGAAQRRGAPLCGNAVWTDGSKITVQRGTTTEVLLDFGGGVSMDNLDVLHGGRALRVDYTGRYGRDSTLTYGLRNGTWTQTAAGVRGWAPAVAGSSGSYLSSVRRSHDGDTVVTATIGTVAGYSTLDLSYTWSGGTQTIPHQLRRATSGDIIPSLCMWRDAYSASSPATRRPGVSSCTPRASGTEKPPDGR